MLNDSIHVPSLDTNLVSCSALNKDGLDVSFVNGKCHILHQSELICTGELRDGVYVLCDVKFRDSALLASEKIYDGESLWHDRFGHTNVAMIRDMALKETVRGLDMKAKIEEGAFCVPCTLGKQTRLTLTSRT